MIKFPLLAIETSCDETAAAVIGEGGVVLSEAVYSQIEAHEKFGGVVPEIASREHLVKLPSIVDRVLQEADSEPASIVVTRGPGLIGCLLVGVSYAKGLSASRKLPLYGVNHIAGHIFSATIEAPNLKPPYLALIVSGGHTELIHVKTAVEVECLRKTVDDAAGEAFDKAAKLLGLGYPGGPAVEAAAREYGPCDRREKLVTSVMPGKVDFSFSGLKTALRRRVIESSNIDADRNYLAALFQETVVSVLVKKTALAMKNSGLKKLVLAGGVAANSAVRNGLMELCEEEEVEFYVPPKKYCTDNAVMIGAAAVAGAAQLMGINDTASPSLRL